MSEWIAAILLLVGSTFMLLAAVGVVRMPDLYMRMGTSTKAATLGLACILAAVAVYFGETGLTARALATIVFVLLTAPVAAHMIGRAGYIVRAPLWKGTIVDELHGKYDGHNPEPSNPVDSP
jgi:multicomponent Na+:H+ antiporter subunit G